MHPTVNSIVCRWQMSKARCSAGDGLNLVAHFVALEAGNEGKRGYSRDAFYTEVAESGEGRGAQGSAILDSGSSSRKGVEVQCRRKMIMSYLRKVEMSY